MFGSALPVTLLAVFAVRTPGAGAGRVERGGAGTQDARASASSLSTARGPAQAIAQSRLFRGDIEEWRALVWESLVAPEGVAGPAAQSPELLENRAWPKIGKLPLSIFMESAVSLVKGRQDQEPLSDGPHIVVEQPTPQVTRAQLAVQLFFDWLQAFGIITALCVVFALVALCYHSRYVKPREDAGLLAGPAEQDALKDWTQGPFACTHSPETCMWGFFCPSIRWADTISITGGLTFWFAFAVVTLIAAVGIVTGEVLLWLAVTIVCTAFRQQLRQKFGMRSGGKTILEDFVLYCCCPCCVVVQEAQHADEALRVGHPVAIRPKTKEEAEFEAAAAKKTKGPASAPVGGNV